MAAANAWVLTLGGNLRVAVGEFEMTHVIPDLPVRVEIPKAPSYCRHVTIWQQRIVPIMDLARRLHGDVALACSAASISTFMAVVAHQAEEKAQYGALLLSCVPVRVRVDDDQACDLPGPVPGWRELALSCFKHQVYGPIPVLDLQRIFSSAVKERPAQAAPD
ncbi:MAG: chemotaxis protein CheW [Gammaproteobacteria bacterium]